MRKRILFLAIAILVIVSAGQVTLAQEVQPTSVPVLNTPAKVYESCSALGDVLYVSGLNGLKLKGQVIGDYMLSDGRINFSYYPVDFTGQTYSLLVVHPPTKEWKAELIHYDVQLEIWNGPEMVGSLGGGKDWGVHCTPKKAPYRKALIPS